MTHNIINNNFYAVKALSKMNLASQKNGMVIKKILDLIFKISLAFIAK